MKATKRQLRRIIAKEKRQFLSERRAHGHGSGNVDDPTYWIRMALKRNPSASRAELEEEVMINLPAYRDMSRDTLGWSRVEKYLDERGIFEGRRNKMKVTKRQLERIIKEERAKLVNEAPRTDGRGNVRANYNKVADELSNIMQMMDQMDVIELEELRAHQSHHWANETIKQLAHTVLLGRADGTYMGG
tara:strand:+ start:303 stop:869 length:567 start_codon:yes stop_codon:yes gene_type:complete